MLLRVISVGMVVVMASTAFVVGAGEKIAANMNLMPTVAGGVESGKDRSWFLSHSCQVHQDFGGGGEQLDFDKLAQAHADAGTELVTITAQQTWCYYPSKYGRIDPNLKVDDFTGKYLAALKTRGINVFVYVAATYQPEIAKEHPDWVQHDPTNQYDTPDTTLCFNSPWKQLCGDFLEEIARKYPVDGFFMDMFGFYRICKCKYCVERYKHDCNAAVPSGRFQENPEWARYLRWQIKCSEEFSKYLHSRVDAVNPKIKIGSNCWYGATDKFEYGLLTQDDYLIGETSVTREPWDYWRDPIRAKYQSSDPLGRPVQLIAPAYMDWTVRNLRNPAELKYEASNIMPVGVALSVGDVWFPDGRVVPSFYESVKVYGDWARKIRPWCFRGQYFSQIALYDGGRFYSWGDGGVYDALSGAYRALSEHHYTFDILHRAVVSRLKAYDCVIVERGSALSDEEMAAFAEYVRGGGKLIAFGDIGTLDSDFSPRGRFAMEEVFGAKRAGTVPWKDCWILPRSGELVKDLPETAMHVAKGGWVFEPAKGAKVLAEQTNNIYAWPWDKSRFAVAPAAIMNSYGKGTTRLFANKAAQSAWQESFQLLEEAVTGSVRMLVDKPLITTDLPKNSEVHVRKDGSTMIVHIVNCTPNKPGAKNHLGLNVTQCDEFLPLYDRTVTMHWPAKCTGAVEALGGDKLTFTQRDDEITVRIPKIAMHGIVVLEFDHDAKKYW